MDIKAIVHAELNSITAISLDLIRNSGVADGAPIRDGILHYEIDFVRVMAEGGARADLGAARRCLVQIQDKLPMIEVYARKISAPEQVMSGLARIKSHAEAGLGVALPPGGERATPSV